MRELLLIAAGTLFGSCLGVTMMCLFQINKDCRIKRKEDTDYEKEKHSVLACGVAVGLYFLLRPYVGTETVSWVCILGAAPFAALGFVKYNGMTAEKAIYAWIKSEFLMPKKLVFHSTNVYYELMKPSIEQKQKEVLKSND